VKDPVDLRGPRPWRRSRRALVGGFYSAGQTEVNEIQCRLGAVSSVECRPGCRDMPLYAAICRSLERKLLIFLGLGFFFASQLRWRSASRAKLAREPEGRGLPSDATRREAFAAEGCSRIPPGAPLIPNNYARAHRRAQVSESDEPARLWRRVSHRNHRQPRRAAARRGRAVVRRSDSSCARPCPTERSEASAIRRSGTLSCIVR
jgi:hypothetical protein